MELSTCSFVLLSIQLTFPILLHTHISKAFKRFISSFLMVHAPHPYRTTGYTSVLTNLFLRSTLILPVSSSFLLLNASFAIPILVLTLSKHLPSSEINELTSEIPFGAYSVFERPNGFSSTASSALPEKDRIARMETALCSSPATVFGSMLFGLRVSPSSTIGFFEIFFASRGLPPAGPRALPRLPRGAGNGLTKEF